MTKITRLCALGALTLGLAACGRPSIDDHAGQGPELEVEEFLSGSLTAHGIFQDLFGDVRRSFVVEIDGQWDAAAQTLTLNEDFVYEDGSTENRVWILTKTGDETWEATTEAALGVAEGVESGNAFNFSYTLDFVTGDGGSLRASVDDYLFQIDDQHMVNIGYVSKWGFDIGTVSIFFRRAEPLGAASGG